jgi:hypothetical protein
LKRKIFLPRNGKSKEVERKRRKKTKEKGNIHHPVEDQIWDQNTLETFQCVCHTI